MKIKNIEMVGMLNAADELGSVEMPVKLAYALKKNKRKLFSEYDDYYKQLKEAEDKYGAKSDEFGKVKRELFEIEFEFDFYKIKMSIDDLLSIENFNVSPQQLDLLEHMIEEEPETEE